MRPFIVGVDQERLAFTVSLTLSSDQQPRSGESFATGYLDDWLIFGFALSDSYLESFHGGQSGGCVTRPSTL